ncbi:hypothetical protein LJC58_03840 [Lachnospiraceae bacterium OttesenSCG-928-D06]|nr:hypothetical protein [Lachnospiraceae bacterium OttesenSCG-928-D06]
MFDKKATRDVCDVDIRRYDTKEPFLFFDTANVTSQNFSGDSVYAMAKGSKRIAFSNPIEGTLTIEAQVFPFEMYALMSDGTVSSDAIFSVRKNISATTDGVLDIDVAAMTGTVFVFATGDFGGTAIEGTYSSGVFTATTPADIATGVNYEVGYVVSKTSGVKRVSFNDEKQPKAYFITMSAVMKSEDDVLTPYMINCYKAQPQRNFEISQSSEGDPTTLKITFDLLADKDGNFTDMIEITE